MYGDGSGSSISEANVFDPLNPYALSKLLSEQICYFYKSLQTVLYVLNLFHEHSFIYDYLYAECCPIQGDCTNLINTLEHHRK